LEFGAFLTGLCLAEILFWTAPLDSSYQASMTKRILIGILVIIVLWVGAIQLQYYLLGTGKEGLFKIGACYRDDEMGLLYRIKGAVKGRTFALILESSKYPSQYKINEERSWSSSENLQKLYPVNCP